MGGLFIMVKKFDSYDKLCFFDSLIFFGPVALLVRTQAGLSISTFLILQAILSSVIFVGEIPAGVFTDKYGYKNTLIISEIMFLWARLFLLLAFVYHSFLLFLIEAMIEGIGHCLSSGTNHAYLYEIYGKEDYLFKLIHATNCGTAGFIISTCCYGVIYQIFGIIGLLVASVISAFMAFQYSLKLKKDKLQIKDKQHRFSFVKIVSILNHKKVFYMIVLSSLFSITGIFISFFYAEKLTECGINVEWLSLIILSYSLIKMLGERIIHQLINISKHIIMISSSVLLGLVMILFGQTINRYLVLFIMVILPLLLSIPCYYLNELENHFIDEINLNDHRATSLSLLNMATNFIDIFTILMSSLFVRIGVSNCFLFVGFMLIVFAFLFFLVLRNSLKVEN